MREFKLLYSNCWSVCLFVSIVINPIRKCSLMTCAETYFSIYFSFPNHRVTSSCILKDPLRTRSSFMRNTIAIPSFHDLIFRNQRRKSNCAWILSWSLWNLWIFCFIKQTIFGSNFKGFLIHNLKLVIVLHLRRMYEQ